MTRLAFLLLLLEGCSPPPRALSSSSPTTSPASSRAPASGSAVAQPSNAEGWYALGDPDSPPAVPELSATSVALGFDEKGQPFAAVALPQVGLAVVTFEAGTMRVEPLHVEGPVEVAAGSGINGPTIAALLSDGTTAVLVREAGSWQRRNVGFFCRGKTAPTAHLEDRPAMAIDRAGRVWQACFEVVFDHEQKAPQPGEMPSPPPEVQKSRLHLGRLESTGWVARTLIGPKTSLLVPVKLATTAGGEPIALVPEWTSFREIVVPMVWENGEAKYRSPRRDGHLAGDWFVGGTETGWFRVGGCNRMGTNPDEPCSLDGTVKLDLPMQPNALARRGDTWFAATASPLRVGMLEGDTWRLLTHKSLQGVSASQHRSTAPALAVDPRGQPVVMWREGGERIAGRAWNGKEWRTLPSFVSAGPHGVAVAQNGDIFVGSWQVSTWMDPVVHVRRLDAASSGPPSPLPALRLDGHIQLSGDPFDYERTRLAHDGALQVSFPTDTRVSPYLHWFRFRLNGQSWVMESATPSSPKGISPPWGDDKNFTQHAEVIDEKGRRLVVWVSGRALSIAHLEKEGSAWQRLPDIPVWKVEGAPAVAVGGGRLCVAWAGASGLSSQVFLRCRSFPGDK